MSLSTLDYSGSTNLMPKDFKNVYTKNIGILPVTLHKLLQCHGFIENSLISLEFLLNYE